MKQAYSNLLITATVVALLLFGAAPAFAVVTLGNTVKSFAVLGASTVTNTGNSVITGNLGVSPGTAVTGFPPGIVGGGTIHAADGVALQAQNELTTAYVAAASPIGNPCGVNLTGQDLGGLTLTPGVYCFNTSAQLTGTLTLNLLGDPNAFFLFQIGSTLTTASASRVLLINTGVPATTCPTNLFWQVGSSATLGTTTSFVGNILAQISITLTTSANLNGRALARTGAVTLDTNIVTIAPCAPVIVCPPITLSPATLPPIVVGIAYSATVTVNGGPGPYDFFVTTGALPAGLGLTGATNTSVNITGTPTTAAPYSFEITATDTLSPTCFAKITYTGVVLSAAGCPVITLSPPGPTLPSGTVGVFYSQTITATGGATLTIIGSLPPGLALNSGPIFGTPTAPGTFNFTIRATGANPLCFVSSPYSIVIAAAGPPASGGSTLDSFGLAILLVLLAVAGVFAVNRFTS